MGDQPNLTVATTLIENDALIALDEVEDGGCQLILTSPPYNIGKEYERDTRRSIDEYIDWLRPIVDKLCEKLSDTGSLCWQTGNYVHEGEVFPLDLYFYDLFKKNGLKLRNRIIWHFNFGLNAQVRFSGRYETLLWWTKSDEYIFNLDEVRVRQLYPGKRHSAKKGAKAGQLSGNPRGKNPSDFWSFSPEEAFWTDPLWSLPNVKANHPEKTFHPCQFPTELAERCILAFTKPGDLVLDPFLGSGTSAIASKIAGRNFVGIDRDPRYIRLSKERLDLLERRELPLREFGKSIPKPSAGGRVGHLPKEWQSGDVAGAVDGQEAKDQ